MISLKQLAGGVAVAAITMSVAAPVMAQQITSAIHGTVLSHGGAPIEGASISIIHTPTGRVTRQTSRAGGVFDATGLRVGGPYVVTISAPGEQPYRQEDIFLTLGKTFSISVVLGDAEDEIIVTAQRGGVAALATGPGAVFDLDTIDGVASTGRDFKDVARLDPLVYLDPTNNNAISIGGGNNRMISITVDGVASNDDFGLNSSGFPTLRSPISIDSIEQIAVETTPFNVEYSGFQSGTVNVVTKSGDNEYHGSAFVYRRTGSLAGDKIQGAPVTNPIDEWTYGGTFGGPIVKDKLFFFGSYDYFQGTSAITRGPAGGSFGSVIDEVSLQDVANVSAIAQSVYGLDSLGFGTGDLTQTDEKILGKIDWNINESHRAQFSYGYNTGNQVRIQNTFGNRVGTQSNWYNNTQTLKTFTGSVFSDWNENFSTELRVSYKEQVTQQVPLAGLEFGELVVRLAPGESTTGLNGGQIHLGPDVFRQANALNNDTTLFRFKGDYSVGQHLITGGAERSDLNIFNLFVPFSRGTYTFNSVADFQNQNASGGLFYQNAVSNNANDGAAEFGVDVTSFYLQDKWSPRDDLTVVYGARYEKFKASDNITPNATFQSRYGFTNSAPLDASIFLPRFGFSFSKTDNITFRGGLGRFAGGNPNVWISNSYTNDGVTVASTFVPGALLPPVDGRTVPAIATGGLVAGNGSTNVTDPNFKIPSVWKASFGIDAQGDIPFIGHNLGALGTNWHVTADVIKSTSQNAVFWKDLTCTQISSAADGRPINNCDTNRFDVLLTNVNKGNGVIMSFLAEKAFDNGLDVRATYTHMNVNDANSGVSSTATSNIGRNATSDRTNAVTSTANFEREHRFTFNINYARKIFGDNQTRFTLFGEERSGQPFSYTFDDRTNRGSLSPFGNNREFARRDTQLFYVPTGAGDPNVDLSGIADQAAFFSFLESSGLNEYAGQIAPRNAFKSSWVSRWDLRISQEIPGVFPRNAKGVFYLDIQNIGNLIDSDWGVYNQVGFPYVEPVVIANVDANGRLVYTGFPRSSRARNSTAASLWSAQVGFKFRF
ncbi:hypothetical protein MNBD_ALPHA06-1937 [hydrothermal vent metagenome]|uniref:TonB-dependent transporter Oar-like beta-barrel domain-containing protein n=1 Tax=hydrothermal vent metagenome TaxID=652676 RepID=A0A3B0SAM9_9ZZZZ